MHMRGPNNVERAVKKDLNLLPYTSAIMEQKNINVRSSWLKSLNGFKLCTTTPNNMQQNVTGCAKNTKFNIQQCCALLANNGAPFAWG